MSKLGNMLRDSVTAEKNSVEEKISPVKIVKKVVNIQF